MDKFISNILKTIDKYEMLNDVENVVAAVSGGYDSLCMLYSLNEIKKIRKFSIFVVHINHSFRNEADSDEQFVIDIAQKLGLKYRTEKYDVSKYAKDNGMSFETAGRILRYNLFNEVADSLPKSVIATAHNANDSVESFFMHLMRGSGLNGLVGIRPKSDRLIRPLINTKRCDIEKYCNANNIVPVVDITNESDDYTRNDLRHNVIPEITKRCSIDSLLRTMDIIDQDNEFCENFVNNIDKNIIMSYNGYSNINVKKFNVLPFAIKRRIIYDILKKYDKQAGLIHVDDIILLAKKNVGNSKLDLPGKIKVIINKGMLKIYA